MSDQVLSDSDWLMQHIPDASEVQEEAFLERVSILLEHNPSPTWAQVEYARKRALEDLK
jgi:hypothetical protein